MQCRAEKQLRMHHLRPLSAFGGVRRRENMDLSNTFQMKNQSQKGDVMLSIFYMPLRVFLFQDTLFIVVELRLVALSLKLSKGKGFIYFVDPL